MHDGEEEKDFAWVADKIVTTRLQTSIATVVGGASTALWQWLMGGYDPATSNHVGIVLGSLPIGGATGIIALGLLMMRTARRDRLAEEAARQTRERELQILEQVE